MGANVCYLDYFYTLILQLPNNNIAWATRSSKMTVILASAKFTVIGPAELIGTIVISILDITVNNISILENSILEVEGLTREFVMQSCTAHKILPGCA